MRISAVRLTPVAIGDPPLRAAFGLHEPFALRTIVEVETDDGLTGISETYGGTAPLRALEAARTRVVGLDPWRLAGLRQELDRADDGPGKFAWEGRGLAPRPLFSAIEVACLDAVGKATGRPVCDLLGGKLRDAVPFSAYLFFKHAARPGDTADDWGEVMSPAAVVGEAEQMVARHGFRSLKLKGGVLPPDVEATAIEALRDRFGSSMPLRLDPNAAWSVPTSIRIAARLAGTLEYLEDPALGIDGMAAVAAEAPMPLATNMCVIAFEHLSEAVAKHAVGIILSDHHLWGGMRATVELGRICGTFGLGLSMHSNSHLGISLAAMVHVAAAVPELTYACDTHYPWQRDEVIVGGKLAIEGGSVAVPSSPGLGVEIDRDALARLHEQYLRCGLTSRDDAGEMRKVDPSWRPHLGDW